MMNKLLLLITASFLTVNVYASTVCSIATSSDRGENFDVELAEYENVEKAEDQIIMTLIKKDGEVLKNFDFDNYLSEAKDENEIDKRLRDLDESKVIIISLDLETSQITISTGRARGDFENMLDSDALSFVKLGTELHVLMDVRNNLAVACGKSEM